MEGIKGTSGHRPEAGRIGDVTPPAPVKPVPVAGVLRVAAATVWAHPRDVLLVVLVVQGAIALLGIPLIARLFDLLDGQVEITSWSALGVGEALANPFADLLLLAIALLIAGLLYLEIAVLLVVAHRHQRGERVTLRAVVRDAVGPAGSRRLRHPSTVLLIPYLLLVVPVGNVGLGLVLSQAVRIPDLVRGEVLSTVGGAIAYVVVIAVAVYLNLRLVFTVSVLVSSDASVLDAMRASWRMTRRQSPRILALAAIVIAATAVVIAGILSLGLLPTGWADANAPDAAVPVAGVSLALIEVLVFLAAGVGAAVLANAVVATERIRRRLALPVRFVPDATAEPGDATRSRTLRAAIPIVAVVVTIGLAVANTATVHTLMQANDTLVIAHRGLVSAGVENTIPALEAVVPLHPDFVEIDIQQTKDGQFAVLHDPTLQRLAGLDKNVGDLTLAELEQITLTQNGHTAKIDSLDDYIERALELDQRLLIELKVRGDETPDYLPTFIATLERYDVEEFFWVHSLDQPTIEELKRLVPRVRTGFIMTFNLGHAPVTNADFVVMQELSYTTALRDEVWADGKELLLWSVDDIPTMRRSLEDDVNGLITYVPEVAQEQRAIVEDDTTVASRLAELVRRLVGW